MLCLIAGCASFDGTGPGTGPFGGPTVTVKTFNAPISRVKPAVVSTVVQMGMSVSAIETRGGREVLKARKGTSSVQVEFERLGPSSTRIHAAVHSGAAYDAAATSRFIQQTEKTLAAS